LTDVADITLSGQGTVELGGTNFYSNLRTQNGTVNLISGGVLSGNAAWLEKTAVLNLNAHTVAVNLFLEDGASVDASVVGSGVATSGAIITAQSTSRLHTAGSPFTVSGDVGAAAGSTLDLSAIDFDTEGTCTMTLAAGVTVTFAEGSTLNLSHLADGIYRIFQPDATGTFEGWQFLTITMDDSDLSRKMINLETDGVLVRTTDKLRWCGTEGSSWATNDRGNWLLQISNNETSFRSNDNVVFGDNATASRHVLWSAAESRRPPSR